MNSNPNTYKSNGKLLLTGEYAVLDGAKALALPTKYGQSLTVEPNDSNLIIWKSLNDLGETWFKDEFHIKNSAAGLHVTAKINNEISKRLVQIFKAARELNPQFLDTQTGFDVLTRQDFNRNWGLGTSSTLINNVANWAKVDAYKLLQKTFGGSGYDIACAQNDSPITFQLDNLGEPIISTVAFNPTFKNQLYFVYLNQKQNSRDGIKAYKKLGNINQRFVGQINALTEALVGCKSLSEFNSLIEKHEKLISELIKTAPIKTQLFSDFDGAVKSLGAWGGDFVLVSSEKDPKLYFSEKGFQTVIPYEAMVLI